MFIYHIKKRCKFLNLAKKKNYTFSAILPLKKSKIYNSFEATSYIAMQNNIVKPP